MKKIMSFDLLDKLQAAIGEWQDKEFGGGQSPVPLIHHLKKEVDELSIAPYNRTEYADCLILLLGAARKAGISADMLIIDAFKKLEVNKGRKWGKPDLDGVIEHI